MFLLLKGKTTDFHLSQHGLSFVLFRIFSKFCKLSANINIFEGLFMLGLPDAIIIAGRRYMMPLSIKNIL